MTTAAPSSDEIFSYLHKITGSPEFSGADRLASFLEYITLEAVEGRSAEILGKKIFLDVYLKDAELGSINDSVVRVDASRLRQRLSTYYSGSGVDDEMQIVIDKGGYAPRFISRAARSDKAPPSQGENFGPRIRQRALFGALLGIAVAGIYVATRTESVLRNSAETTNLARSALLELSPRSLQARNVAEKARNLILPATEIDRVRSALRSFETAIELDPKYHGGFAGASQTVGILARLEPDPIVAVEKLKRSTELAEQAVLLNPDSPWAQSSLAWNAFLKRDFEKASRVSASAVQLDPDNGFVLGFDAMISIFAGDFERALESAAREHHQLAGDYRFPWRNAQGIAFYHLGKPENAIQMLLDSAANGGPVSEINLAHLASAHQASGDPEKASQLVDKYMETWPDSTLSKLLLRIFKNENDANRVLSDMEAAGWDDPLKSPTVDDEGLQEPF